MQLYTFDLAYKIWFNNGHHVFQQHNCRKWWFLWYYTWLMVIVELLQRLLTSSCVHFENDQKWSKSYKSDHLIFATRINPINNPCGTVLVTDLNFDQQQANSLKRKGKLSNRSSQICRITLLLPDRRLQKLMCVCMVCNV